MNTPSPILAAAAQRITKAMFDPKNKDHVVAFDMVQNKGRQHPTLRFELEHPYMDVVTMMQAKITQQYIKQFIV